MRHAMGKRVCLPGPGPRDDKQWLITTVLHSVTLFGVECSEIRLGHWCLGPNHQSHQQALISERLQIRQGALSHFESVIWLLAFCSSQALQCVALEFTPDVGWSAAARTGAG